MGGGASTSRKAVNPAESKLGGVLTVAHAGAKIKRKRSRRGKTQIKLVFFGLDGCGKTTLIHLLVEKGSEEDPPCPAPTESVSHHKLKLPAATVTLLDAPGCAALREQWFKLPTAIDGVVFVLDSTDRLRFPLACESLVRAVQSYGRELPLLALFNKQDSPDAAATEQMARDMQDSGIAGQLKEVRWSGCAALATVKLQQQYINGITSPGGLRPSIERFVADICNDAMLARV